MTKRLLSVAMAMFFVFSCIPGVQAAKTSKSTYKSDKALAYAKAHWNDGKGLCAEFVSDCLEAGGVDDVYERRVVNLFNELKNKGWGTAYKLELTGGTSGRISMSANKGKVSAGDPVFFQCNVCKSFEHVVLCNGADSSGYMKDYAHNNPHDGNRTTYTWRECGTNNWTVYSIRMDETEPIYGTVTSVPAPKVNYAVNVEQGLHIKWNEIDGATGYRVYRRLPKGSWVYLGTVKNTCYTDTKAENGQTYIYTVRACKGNVWSAYYGGMEFAFLSQVKFKSTAIENNSIKVTWNKNEQADGYYLYRRRNTENWVRYADLNKSTTTSFIDKDVETGNTYSYRIRVFKGNVVSSYDVAGIKQLYLGAPKMTEMFNDSTGITFNWESVKGSTGYRIYRRGAGERYWTYLETVKGNSYTDENVKSGDYYRYTVRSAAGNTFGGFDPNGKYLRCVATPTLVRASSSDKKVTLTWTGVEGVSGYYVYHKLVGAKYWTRIATVNNKMTSYVDSDVKLNSSYQYTVKAYYGKLMSSYDATGLSCKVVDKVVPPATTAPTSETQAETQLSSVPQLSETQKSLLNSVEVVEPTTEAVTEPVTEFFIEATEPVTIKEETACVTE